jgi:hypothetical protein
MGDRENAPNSLKKAYEIYKQLKGDDHLDTKEALDKLRNV